MDYEVFSKSVFGNSGIKEFYNNEVNTEINECMEPTRIQIEKLRKLESIVHAFDLQIKQGLGYAFSEYAKEKYQRVEVRKASFKIPVLMIIVEDIKAVFFFCETVAYENRNAIKNLHSRIISDVQSFEDYKEWSFYIPYHDTPVFIEHSKAYYETMHQRYGKDIWDATDVAKQITIQQAFKIIDCEDEISNYETYLRNIREEAATIINFKIIKSYNQDVVNELEKALLVNLKNLSIEGLSVGEMKRVQKLFEKKENQLLNREQDFYHSLLTSEWLYNSLPLKEVDEKTGIVSGYLKAVEQLLVSILSMKASGKEITNIKGNTIVIGSRSWQEQITLGNMMYFLKSNSNNSFYADMGFKTKFIEKLNYWIKNDRNGFFHKDNLYKIQKTEIVRKHCMDMYLLIIALLA